MIREPLDPLDILAGTKIMGYVRENGGLYEVNTSHGIEVRTSQNEFRPTRNIAQAFEVLHEMKDWHPTISYCDTTMSWSCYFTKTENSYTCIEDTAPLAIVKAVLKAKNLI